MRAGPLALRRPILRALALALAAPLLCSPASAHPISLTFVELQVFPDRLELKVKVPAEEFYLLHVGRLKEGKLNEAEFIEGRDKHKAYLLEHLNLLTPEGAALKGELLEVEHDPFPEKGLPFGRMMSLSVEYTLRYPLAGPPTGLTFQQEIAKESALPSIVELTVRQQGFGWSDALSIGKEKFATFGFDWTGKPPSYQKTRPKSPPNEQAGLAEEFGALDGVYSFVYLEHYQLRHELLVPLYLLERFHEIPRESSGALRVAEQAAARPALEAFLKAHFQAQLNGLKTTPRIDKLEFVSFRFEDLANLGQPQDLAAPLARLSVALSYGAKEGLREARLSWDLFDEKLKEVLVQALDGDEIAAHRLSASEPEFVWRAPGGRELRGIDEVATPPPPVWNLPMLTLAAGFVLLVLAPAVRRNRPRWGRPALGLLLGLALAGLLPFGWFSYPSPFAPRAARPGAEAARAVFAALHANLYRAFDYRDESDVYDALAKSVSGELLAELYMQVNESLTMQEQGGARTKIRRVDLRAAEVEDPPAEAPAGAFAVRADWTVAGSVEHWGHVHERTNRYAARFQVEPREGRWKITALNLLDQERLAYETRLRLAAPKQEAPK
ncbi:MAG: hypothetical protein M5U26_05555 [Planctomycetota bacterium]|nr:hypothetical protein [Planctomycetota bacterium]